MFIPDYMVIEAFLPNCSPYFLCHGSFQLLHHARNRRRYALSAVIIPDHQNKVYMVRHDYITVDENIAIDFSDSLCNGDGIQATIGCPFVNLG